MWQFLLLWTVSVIPLSGRSIASGGFFARLLVVVIVVTATVALATVLILEG